MPLSNHGEQSTNAPHHGPTPTNIPTSIVSRRSRHGWAYREFVEQQECLVFDQVQDLVHLETEVVAFIMMLCDCFHHLRTKRFSARA
jgi:hypothetical protein